jgi:redox-sensitive bicupin YhaK (pirin superfamily)
MMISPDGEENTAVIHQDARIYRIQLDANKSISHTLHPGRGLWLQVIEGQADWNGTQLGPGDGASWTQAGDHTITAKTFTHALLFDLA